MPGKRVQLDDETWQTLDVLARDKMTTFQELADEAFRDLLGELHEPETMSGAADPPRPNIATSSGCWRPR